MNFMNNACVCVMNFYDILWALVMNMSLYSWTTFVYPSWAGMCLVARDPFAIWALHVLTLCNTSTFKTLYIEIYHKLNFFKHQAQVWLFSFKHSSSITLCILERTSNRRHVSRLVLHLFKALFLYKSIMPCLKKLTQRYDVKLTRHWCMDICGYQIYYMPACIYHRKRWSAILNSSWMCVHDTA